MTNIERKRQRLGAGHWWLANEATNDLPVLRLYFGQAGRLDDWLRSTIAGVVCDRAKWLSSFGQTFCAELLGSDNIDMLHYRAYRWDANEQLGWRLDRIEQIPRQRQERRALGRKLVVRSHDRLIGYNILSLARWWCDLPINWVAMLPADIAAIHEWCVRIAYNRFTITSSRRDYQERAVTWLEWLAHSRIELRQPTYWVTT